MSDSSPSPPGSSAASSTHKMKPTPNLMAASTPPQPPPPSDPTLLFGEDGLKRGRKESEQRRRVLMNQYYDEMVILLSMISERTIPKKMDKASTLHEAVCCLRTYAQLTPPGKSPPPKPKGKGSKKAGSKVGREPEGEELHPWLLSGGEALQLFLDAHDTFLILVSDSGHILYATELITSLLGHMQTRLAGQNIYNYILESDKPTLLEMFDPGNSTPSLLAPPNGKVLAYPARTLKCHFKLYTGETGSLTQHLPFMCLSYLRRWKEEVDEEPRSPPMSPLFDVKGGGGGAEVEYLLQGGRAGAGSPRQKSYILLLGKLPTNLTLLDLPLGVNDVNFSFDMRVSKNGNIINIDAHAVLILGHTVSEVVGSQFFDYIDPYHLLDVGERMGEIFTDTRGSTNPYRFHTKGGRYIWLLSKGYLSYNPWNHKPDHILLSCRVLGCDHVVPEFRFFRSRSLLPDVSCGDELYNPPPLGGTASPQQQPPHQPLWQQSIAGSIFDSSAAVFSPLLGSDVDYLSPGPSSNLPQQHHVKPETPSVSASGVQHQCLVQSGGKGKEKAPPTAQQGNTAMNFHPSPEQPGRNLPPSVIVDHQQEMDKKNNELFDMQRRLLEQQMLMEQERNQFYQVAQQVMQRIGTPSAASSSSLPSNLRLAGYPSQTGHGGGNQSNTCEPPAPPLPRSSFQSSLSALSAPSPAPKTMSPPTSLPVTQSKPASQPVASSAENFLQSYTFGSDVNPFALLMSSRKSTGSASDASPYTMLLAQSSAGAPANPSGGQQQPQWAGLPGTLSQQGKQGPSRQEKPAANTSVESSPYTMLLAQSSAGAPANPSGGQQQPQWAGLPGTLSQQQGKQGPSRQEKPAANTSVESSPYTMLLEQQSLRGSWHSGPASKQQSWPPPGLTPQQQQQNQLSVAEQGWPARQHTEQQHFKQSQDKPGTMIGNMAGNSPYHLLLAAQQSTSGGLTATDSVQQQGWVPPAQQQGWPAAMKTTQQQQQQPWPGRRQAKQPQQEKQTHREALAVGGSVESTHYSMPFREQSSDGLGGSVKTAGPTPQQWNWSSNMLASAPSTTTPQLPPMQQTQSTQNKFPGKPPESSSLPTLPRAPGLASSVAAPLPGSYQALASQLKLPSFQPHPSLLGGASPSLNLASSQDSTQPSSISSQQQQAQSDSLPLRLPSDEEIQNLLDNIQTKCSSMSIPSLTSQNFP